MDNRFGEMQVFRLVVETGSYSRAARQLRMTPSTVSKLIARIETRLGLRLFERSTRRLSLTGEGRAYYERGGAVIDDFDAIERDLSGQAVTPSGTVRVTASLAFGAMAIEPILPAFWQAYPEVAVDLALSEEKLDLYQEHIDVAFRVGALPDSRLRARRIGTSRRLIVAAPAYLDRHGMPRSVDDLIRHNCLGFSFRRAVPVWPISESGRIVDRAVRASLLANNGETLRRMAVAGVGLARLADYHIRDELAAGRLVEILADAVTPDEEDMHVLFFGGDNIPHRVRVFLDFCVPLLQRFLRDGTG
ncbi:LysR family transcriptional regulator [Labrys sp. KB_33_2]|uniref:LysR family transcriptional regulator n=1 Tax=unclassified Labrys (in: a-proteobacteria) TaxID=2688601 RepID=UPI003EBACE26